MKSLIAIVNSRSRQTTWANAIRETWMSQVPPDKADLKFFVGRGDGTMPNDTVVLDCDDGYHALPSKVQRIAEYAYNQGCYDYVMKLDDDTVVKPNIMLSSGYDKHPYSGRANRRPTTKDPFWVPMGFAYWFCRDGMKYITEATLPDANSNDDEYWVAKNLYQHGFHLHDEQRYHLYMGGLTDQKATQNRPLRMSRVEQQNRAVHNGFAWCVFIESGQQQPPRVPTEEKIKEFHRLFREYGEPRK